MTRPTSLTIRLHCLVNIQREALCNNTHEGVEADPSFTFWSYLAVRTGLGVLTAASLMMFEGAVMATIQVGTYNVIFNLHFTFHNWPNWHDAIFYYLF